MLNTIFDDERGLQPGMFHLYVNSIGNALWCEPCVFVCALIYQERYLAKMNEKYRRSRYHSANTVAMLCYSNCCK